MGEKHQCQVLNNFLLVSGFVHLYVRYIYDATKMLARQNIKQVLVNLLVAQIVTALLYTETT
jgi:hypothetical protein